MHYLVADVGGLEVTGAEAEQRCEAAGILINASGARSPLLAAGVRLGVPSVTTQGMGPAEMDEIAHLIGRALKSATEAEVVRRDVAELVCRFPVYPDLAAQG